MLLLIRESVMEDGWRVLRSGTDCSLDGGVGTGSFCTGALSPSGPRGPNPSSVDSSLVACASTRRTVLGVRGPLPVADFGLATDDSGAGG